MDIGMLFWVIMLIWILFGFAWNSSPGMFGTWGWLPNSLLMWILLACLGWKTFGPMLH